MLLIISSDLTLDFKKSSVCQKFILLSALMKLFLSAPCFFMRLMTLWALPKKSLYGNVALQSPKTYVYMIDKNTVEKNVTIFAW